MDSVEICREIRECKSKKLQAKSGKEQEFKQSTLGQDKILQGSIEVFKASKSVKQRGLHLAAMDLMGGDVTSAAGTRDGSYSCSPRFGNSANRDSKSETKPQFKENFQKMKALECQRVRVFPTPNIYRTGGLGRHSMKALPSKWEDAEKWLSSPNSGTPKSTNSLGHGHVSQKPKSKSGPLIPSLVVSRSPLCHEENAGSSVLQPCESAHSHGSKQKPTCRENFNLAGLDLGDEVKITRCSSVDGWSPFHPKSLPPSLDSSCRGRTSTDDLKGEDGSIPEFEDSMQGTEDCGCLNQVTLKNKHQNQHCPKAKELFPNAIFPDLLAQDKHADNVRETPRLYGSKATAKRDTAEMETVDVKALKGSPGLAKRDAATEMSPAVSRREIATQMSSPRASLNKTPKKSIPSPSRISKHATNSCLQLSEFSDTSNSGNKLISTLKTKESDDEETSKCVEYLQSDEWRKNVMESRALAWEEAERAKWLARFKREEAKVTAWENHQKAKAEADLKKLEVKLERLRSNKTEKIMNKLSSAMKKAEQMRATIAAQQSEHLAKTFNRTSSFRRKGSYSTSNLSACFSFSSCNI